MDKKHLLFVAALAVALLPTRNLAVAQDSASQPTRQDTAPKGFANGGNFQAPSDEDIQLLRKDLRSQKKQIVAANMNLADVEAEKFWPVYDRYTADLARINDAKTALITEYWQTFVTMTGEQAESYIRNRGCVEESIMQLRLKYIPVFRKVLSGRQTALSFQID
jgi:hypothetical protein